MSFTAKNVYGATPATTRGKPVHIAGDPKGKNFLYACGNAVFIRDLQNPLQCELYSQHQHATTVARYAPSGFYIASGDASGLVKIWDTTQKEHILKLELRVLAGPITDLQWSDDSKRIVAVGEGKDKFGSVFLWDTGSSVGELTGHSKAITTCDFKQTRPYRLATGSEDFQVAFLEGPPFKLSKSFKEHTRFVNCVRFAPDGSKLLSVALDKSGYFYDGKTGDMCGKLSQTNGHTAGIYSCSWSPDSKQVLTASGDKTCKIWDAQSGECLKTFNFSDNPQVEHQMLGCLWQGQDLISIALSGDIYYLDPESPNKPKRVIHGHNKFITALAYDEQTKSFYSGSYDSLIVKWDVASGANNLFTGKGHGNQINQLRIQGGNLVSCAMDDTVRITSMSSLQYSDNSVKLDSTATDIAVGIKNSSLVIAVILDAVVVIKDGKIANKLAVKYQPLAVAISVDETQVAVGGKDNKIHLYSLSGTQLTESSVLEGHRGPLSCLCYSPDGRSLGSADINRDIFVWDLSNNKIKVQGWCYHSARVNSLAWARDSVHLASGSLDSNIFIWDTEQPDKRIAIKEAHKGGVNSCVWVDSNTIASCGQDCAVKTWQITFH